jgi:hypothetical protein
MFEGVLIAESLRVGTRLDGLQLAVFSLTRLAVADPAPGQAEVWTVMSFRTEADPVGRVPCQI